eukprot:885652-Prorocentrum_minimum.AAC.5
MPRCYGSSPPAKRRGQVRLGTGFLAGTNLGCRLPGSPSHCDTTSRMEHLRRRERGRLSIHLSPITSIALCAKPKPSAQLPAGQLHHSLNFHCPSPNPLYS